MPPSTPPSTGTGPPTFSKGHDHGHPDHPPARRRFDGRRRHPRHRRVHRTRRHLRLPGHPRGTDRRDPRRLPASRGGCRQLVPRPHDQRRPARPDRHPARTNGAGPTRPLDRWCRGRCGDGAGDRALPVGAARPRHQRRRHPARSGRGCPSHFELLHTWLGEYIGETLGYALTATFTILVVIGVTHRIAPRWMCWAGNASAVLIASGVVIPLGIEAASITNFIGYVVWCLWLIAMAGVLWETRAHTIAACCGSRCSGRLRSSGTTGWCRSLPARPPSSSCAWRWTSACECAATA